MILNSNIISFYYKFISYVTCFWTNSELRFLNISRNPQCPDTSFQLFSAKTLRFLFFDFFFTLFNVFVTLFNSLHYFKFALWCNLYITVTAVWIERFSERWLDATIFARGWTNRRLKKRSIQTAVTVMMKMCWKFHSELCAAESTKCLKISGHHWCV